MSVYRTLLTKRLVRLMRYGWVVVGVMALPRTTVAQQMDVKAAQVSSAVDSARTGAVSPLLLNATLASNGALAIGNGGYDTALSGVVFVRLVLGPTIVPRLQATTNRRTR